MAVYYEGVLAGSKWFKTLQKELNWVDFKPTRSVLRQCATLTPSELSDKYSDLTELIELVTNRKVDGAFVNYYRSESDHAPMHRDSYGRDLCTISFGGTRKFVLKNDATGKTQSWNLADGDVHYFPLEVNLTSKHGVPKCANADPRISLLCFLQ
jgi:hypothetical protein